MEKHDIIHETQNFYVKVGRAIITPGHIMIIPKKHYLAIGEIDDPIVDEYLKLKRETLKAVTEKFAEPFLVEYGVFGQSVFHAHIHIIPRSGYGYQNLDMFRSMILPAAEKLKIDIIKIKKFKELRDYYDKHREYIYFEQDGSKYIIPTEKGSSEEKILALGYRHFFNRMGLEGISGWKNMTEDDIHRDSIKIKETMEKLSDWEN